MRKKILFVLIFLIFLFVGSIEMVYALQHTCPDGTIIIADTIEEAISKCPSTTSKTVSLTNPLGKDQTDIPVLIGKVIKAVLGIVGSLALVMFIYGGITWMTSAGNAEKVQKGKDTLVWAAIGLVIIFASYALVRFVIQDAILGTAI